MTLRQRLDAVADPNPAAREYVGPQPAPVYETAQHPGLRQPFEVRTRLAPALASHCPGLSPRRYLGEVDVEHVRDARPQRHFLAVIHRSQGATSSAYCAVHPPSTSNVVPVTKLEAREARNTAGPTISHTSPNRPCGTLRTTSSYHDSSSMICRTRGVVK
jgi:hypothetical protein